MLGGNLFGMVSGLKRREVKAKCGKPTDKLGAAA